MPDQLLSTALFASDGADESVGTILSAFTDNWGMKFREAPGEGLHSQLQNQGGHARLGPLWSARAW